MNCKNCGRAVMVGEELCGLCNRENEKKNLMSQLLDVPFIK